MTKSKIFLFLCLSFVLGVFIQSLIDVPRLVWLGILVLGVMAAAACWTRFNNLVVAGFCLMALAGGGWRSLQFPYPEDFIGLYNNHGAVNFLAQVAAEPDVRGDQIRYELKILDLEGRSWKNKVLAVSSKHPAYSYGDVLTASCKLKTPANFDNFDYQNYLAKDGIYSICYFPKFQLLRSEGGNFVYRTIFAVKEKFTQSVSAILPEPQAAFLAGLLLGDKRGLPVDVMDDFKTTGTAHIVALSGYNITIIAVALIALFNFFMVRRSISFWASVAAIAMFVLMTGASASAVRAALMGILVLLARQVGRLYSARNALVFAGALMVFLNPRILVFDVGFQLSFAATLGMVYISPIFQDWLDRKKKDVAPGSAASFVKSLKSVSMILIATLSAQIAVLPLLLYNFGQLSLIAPLANLLILPFIPATMLLGFLAGFLGIFWTGLGQIFGWLDWLLLSYEIKVAEWLAAVPGAAVNFKVGFFSLGLLYFALILIVMLISGKKKIAIRSGLKREAEIAFKI